MSDNTGTQKTEWQNRELGALWKRTSKNSGQKYLAGHIKEVDEHGVETRKKVVIFANRNKQEGERTPDYRVYESQENSQKQESQTAPSNTGEELEETL
tara:strand:- start:583 stop:876 length:294 start_codon:yes stop_codon:yes gene_type:complete